MVLLLWRLTRAGCTSDTKTLSLVLTLVLRLGEFEGDVGYIIPGVVDADEQQQHRCRGDDEPGIGDERQDRMPEPVFQHRLIVCLPAHTPEHDDDVGYPPETAEAKQHTRPPERLPAHAP